MIQKNLLIPKSLMVWGSSQIIVWTLMIQRNSMIPRYSMIHRDSIGSNDFDNPKVFGDTSSMVLFYLISMSHIWSVKFYLSIYKLLLTSVTDIVIVVTIVSSWRVEQIFLPVSLLSQEYISQPAQSRESDLWIQIIHTGSPFSRNWPDIFPKVHTNYTSNRPML